MRILITGGAGFIGRHVARECINRCHSVTILDNYSEQIHGTKPFRELERELRSFILGDSDAQGDCLRLVRGDVCDPHGLTKALAGVEAVVHLAAETGTGQSMYEVSRYERVNIGGTAVLLELLVSGALLGVRRLVLASSRAVYGEGKYRCGSCGIVYPGARSLQALAAGVFEPACPCCRQPCLAVPTDEQSPVAPSSFYGLTKLVQEEMVRLFAGPANVSAFILRFQNVYGPTQSLRNPYTGILSIFTNLARANEPINIFEDGQESRDFVYVEDVARATCACVESPSEGIHTLNIGSGQAVRVIEVAEAVVRHLRSRSAVTVTGQFRVGDVRHNVADLNASAAALGYRPTVAFANGIGRFLDWAVGQQVEPARYEQSLEEMRKKGLIGSASRKATTKNV